MAKCACCDVEIPDDTDAWRITVRGEGVELRGHLVGDIERTREFAKDMEPYGLVIASPMEAIWRAGDTDHERGVEEQ